MRAEEIIKKPNIISAFLDTAAEQGNRPCMIVKQGTQWQTLSWKEVSSRILSIAWHLRQLGINKGDRVALLLQTSLEWTLADCAIMSLGAITVPIYCSITPERVAHILKDSVPKIVLVGNHEQLQLTYEARQMEYHLPEMKVIAVQNNLTPLSFDDLSRPVDERDLASLRVGVTSIHVEDPASYVYTSGTTGELKGVVISHRNIIAEVYAARRIIQFREHEVGLMFLPLAHVIARVMQFYGLAFGSITAYAESIEALPQNFLATRPHFFLTVPRILEKVYERVHDKMTKAPAYQRRLFFWAVRIGSEHSRLEEHHQQIPRALALKYALADRLVFKKLRARFGGRIRAIISGGSSLSEEIARFFHAAGILVLECYGLTETFAAVIGNTPDDFRFGTIGKPMAGVEVKLAPDGEILLRGPSIFRTYHHLPEATREAFDPDGWFFSGDLGVYTKDGFLRLLGRKKDIIVTAGAKNIAPQMIEALLEESKFIKQCMVYGNERKYLTALVTLEQDAVRNFLQSHGHEVQKGSPLSQDPEVRALITHEIETRNRKLARFETIKKFAIVDGEFTIANGELTPTLKLRRQTISEHYHHLIEPLYPHEPSFSQEEWPRQTER